MFSGLGMCEATLLVQRNDVVEGLAGCIVFGVQVNQRKRWLFRQSFVSFLELLETLLMMLSHQFGDSLIDSGAAVLL